MTGPDTVRLVRPVEFKLSPEARAEMEISTEPDEADLDTVVGYADEISAD